MPAPFLGSRGHPHPSAGTRVRCDLQRCRKQGGGLLHTEPVEGGIVSARKLKADAAVDHRYGIRVQGGNLTILLSAQLPAKSRVEIVRE